MKTESLKKQVSILERSLQLAQDKIRRLEAELRKAQGVRQ